MSDQIRTAEDVHFGFFLGQMDAMLAAGVPEAVIKAMAARLCRAA
jgi:hypothetical protein